jgi:hypothetical protein
MSRIGLCLLVGLLLAIGCDDQGNGVDAGVGDGAIGDGGLVHYFSWQDHPGGGPLSLPPGNYTTPNSQQCGAACGVWASVGAMEMQLKVDQANPSLTIQLDPYGFLGQFSNSAVCDGKCDVSPFEMSCVLGKLRDTGTPRSASVPSTYKITSFTEITDHSPQNIYRGRSSRPSRRTKTFRSPPAPRPRAGTNW